MSHNPQHYDNFVRLSNTVIMLFMRYNLVEVNMPDNVIKNNYKEFEESCLLIDIYILTENNCLLQLTDKPSLAGYLNPDLVKVNFTCTKSQCIHSVNVCTYAATCL